MEVVVAWMLLGELKDEYRVAIVHSDQASNTMRSSGETPIPELSIVPVRVNALLVPLQDNLHLHS